MRAQRPSHPFPLLTPTAASPRPADSFGDIGQRASKMMRRPKSTRSSESQRAQWEQTSKERQECVDISEEKVALAEQTYELVDGHVRRLDETLRQFEAELRQADPSRLADLKLAAVQPDPFAAAGLQNGRKRCEAGPGLLVGRWAGGGSGGPRSAHRLGVAGRGSRELLHGDMPVDDNEPRYCTCKQVSFGEMVACDNDDVRAPRASPTPALSHRCGRCSARTSGSTTAALD